MKPVIMYDLDEVLNYLSKAVVAIYNKEYDDNFDWKSNTKYWWGDNPLKVSNDYFAEVLNRKDVFYNVEPQLEGFKYMLEFMHEGYEVYILTYPQWNEYCCWDKIRWIKEYMPFFHLDNLIMCKKKGLLAQPNRILLDDNMSNLIDWKSNGGIAVAYDFGFNQEWDGLRVYNHREFYDLVKDLEKCGVFR